MNQAIALRAQYQPIDYAGAAADGQDLYAGDVKLQNAQKKSDLEGMELDDAMGQQSALKGYRQAAQKDDSVSALEELDAYPEMQTKIFEALDGMPVKERIKAKKKSEAYGRAARWVQSYPEGSPERQRAWETSLNVLKRDGYLDDEMYRMGMENGPSDLLLNEYVTADEFMKQYDPKARAQVRNIENQIENRNRNTESQMANRDRNVDSQIGTREGKDKTGKPVSGAKSKQREDNALRRVDAIARENGIEYGTPEYADLKAQVFAEMGIGGDMPAGAGDVAAAGQGKNVSQFDMMTAPKAPPDRAVEHLRQNPQLAEEFDRKYGPGAAAAALGE